MCDIVVIVGLLLVINLINLIVWSLHLLSSLVKETDSHRHDSSRIPCSDLTMS